MSLDKSISVIIPVLDEEEALPLLLAFLSDYPLEVIVVDGGSKDKSRTIAEEYDAIVIRSDLTSRAYQLHTGAAKARGDILYFVHADTIPPEDFKEQINHAISEGCIAGCFPFEFNSPDKRLAFQAKQTEKLNYFSGGGDQSLFVLRDQYFLAGGYKTDMSIMEDFEFFRRLKKYGKVCVCTSKMLVSARKYEKNHYWKVQFANALVFFGFTLGLPQHLLRKWYASLLN